MAVDDTLIWETMGVAGGAEIGRIVEFGGGSIVAGIGVVVAPVWELRLLGILSDSVPLVVCVMMGSSLRVLHLLA